MKIQVIALPVPVIVGNFTRIRDQYDSADKVKAGKVGSIFYLFAINSLMTQ